MSKTSWSWKSAILNIYFWAVSWFTHANSKCPSRYSPYTTQSRNKHFSPMSWQSLQTISVRHLWPRNVTIDLSSEICYPCFVNRRFSYSLGSSDFFTLHFNLFVPSNMRYMSCYYLFNDDAQISETPDLNLHYCARFVWLHLYICFRLIVRTFGWYDSKYFFMLSVWLFFSK